MGMALAMGMALDEDNLHLATESQVKLGKNACRSLHHELLNSNLLGEYKVKFFGTLIDTMICLTIYFCNYLS